MAQQPSDEQKRRIVERIRTKNVSSMSLKELAFLYRHDEPTREELTALKYELAKKKKFETEHKAQFASSSANTSTSINTAYAQKPAREQIEIDRTTAEMQIRTQTKIKNEQRRSIADAEKNTARAKKIECMEQRTEFHTRSRADRELEYIKNIDIAQDVDDENDYTRSDRFVPAPTHPQKGKGALIREAARREMLAESNEELSPKEEKKRQREYEQKVRASVASNEAELANENIIKRLAFIVKTALHEPVFVISFVILLFLVIFLRPFLVPSGSMIPTLQVGDRILSIVQYFPTGETYSRGDIACFNAPDGTVYVKRVIGIGGDHIQINGEKVYVNGEESEWQGTGGVMTSMDVYLDDDEYWMMGDNRGNSADSRVIGPIKAKNMISKVFAIYQPLDRMQFLK